MNQDKVSAQDTFKIRYVSPSIVRCGQYDFCLEYSEPGVSFCFNGVESGHKSGGMLYFPTAAEWDIKYPSLKGQRERIKNNIINYTRESLHVRFVSDFLLDEERIFTASQELEKERAAIKDLSIEEVTALSEKRVIEMRPITSQSCGLHRWDGRIYLLIRCLAYGMLFALVVAVAIAFFSTSA